MTVRPGQVWVCQAVDTATNTCTEGAWQTPTPFGFELPTVAQAQAVGGAFLVSWALLAAALLLKPPKEKD